MRESLKFKTENKVKLSREVTVNKVRYKYFRVGTHIYMVSSRFFIEAPFYTNTHTMAFTNGHTIKVSVPGFFFPPGTLTLGSEMGGTFSLADQRQ